MVKIFRNYVQISASMFVTPYPGTRPRIRNAHVFHFQMRDVHPDWDVHPDRGIHPDMTDLPD